MTTVTEELIKREPFLNPGQITAAVVTGGHPFNVPGFHNLLRSLEGVDCYLQHLEQFTADWGHVRAQYDVVFFFNWALTENGQGGQEASAKEILSKLGETSQGIVLLHHAISAYPQWEFWSELVGIPHEDRIYTLDQVDPSLAFGEKRHFEVADQKHPIVQGISAWDMYGETWGIIGDPGPGCHWLLTSDHPKMRMKAAAWTHQFKKARVFCLQPGHNNDSWGDPNFRKILSRGIHWVAERL